MNQEEIPDIIHKEEIILDESYVTYQSLTFHDIEHGSLQFFSVKLEDVTKEESSYNFYRNLFLRKLQNMVTEYPPPRSSSKSMDSGQ